MRALVLHQPGQIRLEDLPEPQVPGGWALVRPRLVGICGSDLHAYTGHQPFAHFPIVPGHEFVGEIVRLPRGVPPRVPGRNAAASLRPGMRVVADPAVPCGQCRACRTGHYNVCANQQVLGVHLPGAMAELVAVRTDCLNIVPDVLSDEAAVLAEPLSIGLQGCNRGRIGPEDRVAVVGGGMIGASVLLQARLRGARVAMVEPRQDRAEKLADLGAQLTIPPSEAEDVLGRWDDGPTVIVEAAGRRDTLDLALRLAQPMSRVVVLGFWPEQVQIPGAAIMRGELEVLGSRLHGATMAVTLAQMAAGMLETSGILETTAPLEEGPALFEALSKGAEPGLKVVLEV
ncbi:MAG: alcohol dehydrogenase catalytic domain-containing protein [Armatimonadetes bacterium]|nr:alcohol dehydrogenase catalytic domain-containing protein [Armatimonadota bacterium]